MMWYSRACGSYHDFRYRGLLLTRKILNLEFIVEVITSPNFKVTTMTWLTVMKYGRHKWQQICSVCCYHNLSSFMTYYQVCNKSNTTDATCGTKKEWSFKRGDLLKEVKFIWKFSMTGQVKGNCLMEVIASAGLTV